MSFTLYQYTLRNSDPTHWGDDGMNYQFALIKMGSIQIKIILVVIFVALLQAFLTAFFFSNHVTKQIIDQTYQNRLDSLQNSEWKICSEIARRAEVTSNLATQINLLQTDNPRVIHRFLSEFLADLHVSANNNNDPLAAYIVYPNGKLIYSGLNSTFHDLKQRPWWNRMLQGKTPEEPLGFQLDSNTIWLRLSFIGNVHATADLTTVMPVYWVITNHNGGLKYVVGIDFTADLSETPIGPLFSNVKYHSELYTSNGVLLAIPSSGALVNDKYLLFHNYSRSNPVLAKAIADGPAVSSARFVYENAKGAKVLGIYWRGAMGYIYTQEVPLNEIYGPINREVAIVIWTSLLIAIIGVFSLTWFLMRDVVHPVRKLSQAMNRLGTGELTTRIKGKRNDEFGLLYQKFNSTAEQLEILIREAYVQRLARRQSELEFLQSQINPHFLYNTLDCIYRLVLGGNQTESGKAILNLSRLFRLSLSRGPAIVTIAAAMEQLGHYIELQQLRHGDRIKIDIGVAPDIMEYQIFKLLLQPIVENAFVHGLEPKKGAGRLSFIGFLEDRAIHFTIMDDGIGIAPEQLAQAQAALSDPSIKNAHGLVNVHRRLVLTYGEEWGVTLTANPVGGLRVDIRWPALPVA
jgi:sensor histidine kinase YesM